MQKLFMGGSRRVSSLPASVEYRIDHIIIATGLSVLVGDADGADKAFQSYLYKREYQNVEVFCSGSSPRNNVGGWPLRCIEAARPAGTVGFYTAKDRAMADEATAGFMVWD